MTTSLHLPTRPLTSVWCTLNGQRVHARVASAASPLLTPIVLVHGLSVSSRYMVPTAKRLAPFRQVFAPDLPGFGRSDKPQHILNVPELADALIGWMDMYGIAQATLLGNSMGCQIIADIALRYPNRLDRAIFVGPTMDRAARTMPQQALRLAHDALYEPLSSLLTQGRDYFAAGFRRTITTLRYGLEDHLEKKAPHVHVPVLIVRGVNDPIAPQRWCEELVQLLPRGYLAVVRGAPHATNYDAPDALAQLTLQFLGVEAQQQIEQPETNDVVIRPIAPVSS